MNCLILAAGEGSRLRTLSQSKPLADVLGTPLIEHVVRRAAAAGCIGFTIVTGYRADEVEAFLSGLKTRLGVAIETVRIADWSRPNGFSVAAGAERIEGEYLLLMTDHLFDPRIASDLVRGESSAGVRLAVDRNLDKATIDLDDATKVQTDGKDSIVAIGKQLARYDAIDTGLFRAGPALREAILEAVAEGLSGTLSDGVQRLADRGCAHIMDIGEAWWIDVDDPRAHALAEKHLAETPSPVSGAA